MAGGSFAGEAWPAGMLDGPVCTLGEVTARVIAPQVQIVIKQQTPQWNPALPRRAKDAADIEALRTALEASDRP